MTNRERSFWMPLCVFALFAGFAGVAQAQDMAPQPGTNMASMKFVTIPPLPTCTKGSIANGNPTQGPSVILAKATTGCVIPWHWHTPNEHVMIVAGLVRLQMKDAKPVTLNAGGFALMPSHHQHQFKCLRSCVLYIYSDAVFDIHYVDKKGNEIQPVDAMKAVRQKVATEMK